MRRIAYVVLLAFLIALIPGSILVSASETKPPIPVHIADRDFISVGSFDCWLHADGKTWPVSYTHLHIFSFLVASPLGGVDYQ